MKKHLMIASAQSALLFSLIAGCDETRQEEQTEEFETKPAVLKSALERPIQSCQRERISCRRDADDRASREACDDALASCLESAADRALAVARALRECRDTALECVRDGDRRSTCRAQFEGCVERALSDEPTPSDAGDGDEETPRGDAGVGTRRDAEVEAPDAASGSEPDEADGGTDEPSEGDASDGGAGEEPDQEPSEDDAGESSEEEPSEGDAGLADASVDDGEGDDGDGDDANGDDANGDDEASDADAGVPDGATGGDDGAALDAGASEDMPEQLQCVTRMRLCVARDPRRASDCADQAQSCLDRT